MDDEIFSKLSTYFHKQARLVFLTVKGPEDHRSQKIGYVGDLCRRVSDAYFIVRESNKAKGGYHFHALVSIKKDIKPTWYRKGVHMNVQELGRKVDPRSIPESFEESWVMKYGDKDISAEDRAIADCFNRAKAAESAKRSKGRKLNNVDRVLEYMVKDWDAPSYKIYTNYISTPTSIETSA